MKYFLFVFVLSILMHVFDFIKWSEAKLSRSAYVECVLIAVAAGALGYDWGWNPLVIITTMLAALAVMLIIALFFWAKIE